MYDIRVDAARAVIEVKLGGLMGVEEIGRYIHDLRRAMVSGRLGAAYAMVIDVSDCPIQSQDMIRAMGEHLAAMPKARALARMQVRRLFTQSYARLTETVEEGRAWVHDGKNRRRSSGKAEVRSALDKLASPAKAGVQSGISLRDIVGLSIPSRNWTPASAGEQILWFDPAHPNRAPAQAGAQSHKRYRPKP